MDNAVCRLLADAYDKRFALRTKFLKRIIKHMICVMGYELTQAYLNDVTEQLNNEGY